MISRISILVFVFIGVFILLVSENVPASTKVGNGGDWVRARFILIGNVVIDFLKNSPEGQKVVQENNLDIEKLKKALNTEFIRLSDGLLLDNNGVEVDARFVDGQIELNRVRWKTHYAFRRDVTFLVFHEMLRFGGYNDDQYQISEKIEPLPKQFRILLNVEQNRMIGQGSINDKEFDAEYLGIGCPNEKEREIKIHDNVITFSLHRDRNSIEKFQNLYLDALKSKCRIQFTIPAQSKKQVILNMMDINGEVFIRSKTKYSVFGHVSHEQNTIEFNKLITPTATIALGQFQIRSPMFIVGECGSSFKTDFQIQSTFGSIFDKFNTSDLHSAKFYFSYQDCKPK